MIEEFRKNTHQLFDWIADYHKNIESYPVKSTVQPGSIKIHYNQKRSGNITKSRQISISTASKCISGIFVGKKKDCPWYHGLSISNGTPLLFSICNQ
jgi:hypothetical protein